MRTILRWRRWLSSTEEVLRFILRLRRKSISKTAKLCFMCICVGAYLSSAEKKREPFWGSPFCSQVEQSHFSGKIPALIKNKNIFAPSCCNWLASESLLLHLPLPPLQKKWVRFCPARMTQKFHSEFAPWHRSLDALKGFFSIRLFHISNSESDQQMTGKTSHNVLLCSPLLIFQNKTLTKLPFFTAFESEKSCIKSCTICPQQAQPSRSTMYEATSSPPTSQRQGTQEKSSIIKNVSKCWRRTNSDLPLLEFYLITKKETIG